jgi:hypothetical protein
MGDEAEIEFQRRKEAVWQARQRRWLEEDEARERRAAHFKRYRWIYRPLIGFGILLFLASSVFIGLGFGLMIAGRPREQSIHVQLSPGTYVVTPDGKLVPAPKQ